MNSKRWKSTEEEKENALCVPLSFLFHSIPMFLIHSDSYSYPTLFNIINITLFYSIPLFPVLSYPSPNDIVLLHSSLSFLLYSHSIQSGIILIPLYFLICKV